MTSAKDDARRSPAPPRRSRRAIVRRVLVRGLLVLATVAIGLAWPLRLAEWGSPEVSAFLITVGAGTLTLALYHGVLGLMAWRRRRREPRRLAHEPGRRPGSTEAWLHVVTGPDRARIAEVTVAVAAELLEREGRVVVMDAGRRLRLHEVFGREPRWGVGECLSGELPLLGLVQDTGCPGLYLLAHGAAARAEDWPRLGRVLDDAQAHFAHCVLALDAAVPHEAGEALTGRHLEGWWAGSGAPTRNGLAFSERTGITVTSYPLVGGLEAALERLVSAADVPAPIDAPRPVAAAAPPEWSAAQRPAPATIAEPTPSPFAEDLPPSILDDDGRVRERLRFLVWARSLRPKRQESARVSTAATS